MVDATKGRPVQRNQGVEALRIIAAYCIVAYHGLAPFHDVVYAGLIIFLILSPYLDCAFNWTKQRRPVELMITFLVPWLFWMVFYAALNVALGDPILPAGPLFGAILFGTSTHLWFMPAIFFVLLLLNGAKTFMSPFALFVASATIGEVLLATSPFWRPLSLEWASPLPQWIHAAPAICFGMMLGLRERVSVTARMIAAAGLAVAYGMTILWFMPESLSPYAIGIIAVCGILSPSVARWTSGWDVRPISACMLGVYLSHIFWLRLTGAALGHGNYVTITVAFTAALLTTWAAQRMLPVTQLVIGTAARRRSPERPKETTTQL